MAEKQPPLLDQAARDRIARDFTCNLLVEAGAGSGKTHMMAVRMAAGIAGGAYLIEHMAAVTFTRKAASELRGRFQEALEAELRTSSDPERQARVRHALDRLERFFAGTIHAFCGHLLRQHPVEAGLSPVFEELDEIQDGVARRNAWREFMKQAHGTGDLRLRELLEAGVTRERLDEAFKVVCGNEDVTFPAGDAVRPATAAYWKHVDAFFKAIEAIRPDPLDTDCKLQERWGRFSRTLKVTRDRRSRPAALASVLSILDNKYPPTQNRWPAGAGKQAKNLLEAFRAEAVTPFMTAWREYLYGLIVTLMTDARGHARRERARRSALNYNDLLLRAAELLRERPDVRRQLQQKFRWLFVDEFQDTDPVQAEIMFLLAGESSSPDWREAVLRDGALFVVGDPKQSIYRFRRADIQIYSQVRAAIEGAPNGRVELLTTSFRATPELCAWANSALGPLFPAAATDVSPAFAALNPRRDKATGAGAPVYTLTVPGRVGDARPLEAAAIARYIRSEIDEGRRRPGDFLILTRNRPQLPIYMRALEELRVPIEVSGAGAFGESMEVAALALLLRALGDPHDGVTLIGVLRGPLFGASDADLWEWKASGGRFSIFADDDRDGRVADALKALRQFHRWTRVLPLPAALERILDETGYLALAAISPDGVEAGDLVHAVDRVRSVVEEGGSLFEAADVIDSDEEEALDVESLPLEPGRLDVVRLMNLHKAKGLEAKVVFLADPGARMFDAVDKRIVREGDGASGWFIVEEEKERSDGGTYSIVIARPTGWDGHVRLELPFKNAEDRRLLYVAATRAAEMLVVGRGTTAKGPWKGLDDALVSAPELQIPRAAGAPPRWKADVSAKAREKASKAREVAHTAAREASWSASSVTAAARHLAKLARDAEGAADDPTRVITADTRERRADAGMAWGTLVHGLLEHAMRHDKVDEADLRRLALWLTVETPELRPIIDEAIATVAEVMQSEFWKTAKNAEHLVETPFAVQTSKRDVLFGMVDLMFKSKDGWKLVDYKTDATLPAPGGGKDSYALQLKAYEDAMKRCNVPTSGAVLHPVRRGSVSQG